MVSDDEIHKLVRKWVATEDKYSRSGVLLPPDPPYPCSLLRDAYEDLIDRGVLVIAPRFSDEFDEDVKRIKT